MTTQLTLPDLTTLDNQQLAELGKAELEAMQREATDARDNALSAYTRGWRAGKIFVTIGDRMGPGEFEDYARANISENYWTIYKCTEFALRSPDAPPSRCSQNFKQLEIALGNEPEPKQTPRKTDIRFVNVIASLGAQARWWRGGDALNYLTAEERADMKERFKIANEIYEAL